MLTCGENERALRLLNLNSVDLAQESLIDVSIKPDRFTIITVQNEVIVGFTQACAEAIDYFTLDVFQVTLIAETGSLFTLCPSFYVYDYIFY